MALHWEWNEKCGELTVRQTDGKGKTEDYSITLYEGNALLIMLYEYEDEGVDKCSLFSFFTDKQHMRGCLGLAKNSNGNIFQDNGQTVTKIRLNKSKSRYWKDITTAFIQAFDEITVEVFTEA